jgi:hypothetical protein
MDTKRAPLLALLVTVAAAACGNVVVLGSNSGSTSGTTAGTGGSGATTTSTSATSGVGGSTTSTTASSVSGTGGGTVVTSAGSGGSGGAATSSSSGGPPGDPTVSTSPASSFEYDTHLAVASNGAVFVTWVGVPPSGTPFIGYAVSSDGAHTFPVRGTVPTPGGRSADHPTLAADGQGNVYLAWLGYAEDWNGSQIFTHVYVAVAAAGATTFGDAVEASDSSDFTYANPWITVTPMGTPLVTFQRSGMTDVGIVAARSTDTGMTWATSAVATDTHLLDVRDLPYPCVSTGTGRIFVTYFSDDPAAGTSVGIGWSDDDGSTWISPSQAPAVTPTDGTEPGPSPPRCVAAESSVRVAFGYMFPPWSPDPSSLPGAGNISYTESVDDGETFDLSHTSLVVAGTANDAIATLQLTGDAAGGFDLVYYWIHGGAISYRSGRAPNGAAFGTPNANTFDPHDAATIAQVSYDVSRTSHTRLGDYTGLAATTTTLHTSYVDNTSGASHIRVHAAPLP